MLCLCQSSDLMYLMLDVLHTEAVQRVWGSHACGDQGGSGRLPPGRHPGRSLQARGDNGQSAQYNIYIVNSFAADICDIVFPLSNDELHSSSVLRFIYNPHVYIIEKAGETCTWEMFLIGPHSQISQSYDRNFLTSWQKFSDILFRLLVIICNLELRIFSFLVFFSLLNEHMPSFKSIG